jgi:uncharacterized protein (TIGR03083 family)
LIRSWTLSITPDSFVGVVTGRPPGRIFPIAETLVTDSIWPTIHAERQSLADDLVPLTDQQWATRSLCSEWNVHQVLAHLLSAAKMTPPKFYSRFAAAGFNFDRFAAKQVALEGAGGPTATLAAFRAAQLRRTAPGTPHPEESQP